MCVTPKITHFLERVSMEHIGLICSLESDQTLMSICYVRVRFWNQVIFKKRVKLTFFGERPSGPIFGASEEVAPTSPPTTRRKTSTIAVGSNFGGMIEYYPVSEEKYNLVRSTHVSVVN